MARHIHVVINPASGQPKPVLHTINSVFRAAGLDWEASITQKSGDGHRLAQEAVAAGADVVAAFSVKVLPRAIRFLAAAATG